MVTGKEGGWQKERREGEEERKEDEMGDMTGGQDSQRCAGQGQWAQKPGAHTQGCVSVRSGAAIARPVCPEA